MMRPSNFPAHVYVAADGRGWHKIGKTADLKLREYHLSRDRGCAVRIVHHEPLRLKADLVEVAAHWLLSERENEREWFKVEEAEAVEAVKQALFSVERGHVPHARFAFERRKAVDAEQDAMIRAALRPKESFRQFIREAVERELERRESVDTPRNGL